MDFASKLLSWYKVEGRDLPWRQPNNTPYRVVISEFMLQQTQVPRVIEKFQEFLTLFPSIQDLATATKAEVIKAWSGLGYNRRALLLHSFAKAVWENHNGIIPKTAEKLITLPGIGPYSAGSVSSFAFNQPSPAIDVNVRRIFQRYFNGKDQGLPESKSNEKELFELVLKTIPKNKSSEFHNALMDFGSGICTRYNPKCNSCFAEYSCKFAPLYKYQKDKVMYVMEKKKEKGITEDGKYIPHRIFRGRIVEWVRQNEGFLVDINKFGSIIKKDYTDEKEWLLKLIGDLQKDHLLEYRIKNERIKLKIANS